MVRTNQNGQADKRVGRRAIRGQKRFTGWGTKGEYEVGGANWGKVGEVFPSGVWSAGFAILGQGKRAKVGRGSGDAQVRKC